MKTTTVYWRYIGIMEKVFWSRQNPDHVLYVTIPRALRTAGGYWGPLQSFYLSSSAKASTDLFLSTNLSR